MPGTLIDAKIEGMEEIQAKLAKLPDDIRDEVNTDVGKYIVELLKKYPTKKYVTRKQAYGVTFFSDKQRRWFFANLNSGNLKVPYPRTQNLARTWQVVVSNKEALIANDAPYASYVIGEKGQQSRHAAKIGWKSTSVTIKEKTSQILKRIVRAGSKALRKAGQKGIKF